MKALGQQSNGSKAAAKPEAVPRCLVQLADLRKRWEREAGENIGHLMIPANLALLDVLDALEVHPREYEQVLGKIQSSHVPKYLRIKQ